MRHSTYNHHHEKADVDMSPGIELLDRKPGDVPEGGAKTLAKHYNFFFVFRERIEKKRVPK